MANSDYSWTLDEHDPMIVVVSHHGQAVMRFFLGEAIESAGKTPVMKHIDECNRTPWIHSWHETDKKATWRILTDDIQQN